jgi:glyoxylase-like metal-dependent hydrolase (beta-lactamase superfamily II)
MCYGKIQVRAAIAQLVEHQLPKLRVAGSSPVGRSKFEFHILKMEQSARTVFVFARGGGQTVLEMIKEGIFVKNGSTNVGIVKIEGTSYVIDTGSNVKFAKELFGELEGENLVVLNTHSHADHIQGNAFFERNGAKIFSDQLEIPFIRNPELESFYLYGSVPPKSLRAGFYKAKPSHAHPLEEANLPTNVQLVPLKGHSLGMTGFKIDDALFCGDAYFGEEVLEKYSYPYLIDVKGFLDSLESLQKTDAAVYVPSHGKVTSDPHNDIEKTRSALYAFINGVLDTLEEEKSVEESIFEVTNTMNVTLNNGTFYLFRSFVSAILSYLEREGEISQISAGKWKKL